MPGQPSQRALIKSLPKLKTRLTHDDQLGRIIERACQINPWFTKYYVQKALDGITLWFDEVKVSTFLQDYPAPGSSRKVGLITAGNVPLVGFHDLLMVLLAGHQAVLKPSHQDRVLTDWVVDNWVKILPELNHQLQIVDHLPAVDFLIGTGSDNTARYLEELQPGIPRLIRRNRFSVAVLDRKLTSDEAAGLMEDILLFNGLGCRNVSHLLIHSGADRQAVEDALKKYSSSLLNPLYLEKVAQEEIKARMLGEPVERIGPVLLSKAQNLGPLPMGYLGTVEYSEPKELDRILKANQNQIQVVVGIEVPFGRAQKPGLADFADGVDTLEKLLAL